MNNNHPQVLVVGAGPTGLGTAMELRRRGIQCRIIERRPGPSDTSRAITVHARTLEMLEDIGIVERFLHGGVRNDGYVFNFKGSDMKAGLDYTRLPTRYPFVCMFNQNETEKVLRDHLEHDLSLSIEWSTELTSIEESADGTVTVSVNHKTGNSESKEIIKPDWVIACDGLHSPTRECLGFKYEGSEYEGLVMQMVDAELENFEGSDHMLHYYIAEDTFLMIGKLAGPNHRVLVSSQGDSGEFAQEDHIGPIVADHLPTVKIGEPEWKTTWEIWIRKADAYRKGHVFLCGESAHVHSVAGGQGWNVCIQDAYNLVWKIALVIQGYAKPALLDTYEREREPVTDQVIEGSSAVHEIILAHGQGLADRMALTQSENWQDNAVARISGLSYNYRGLIELPSGTATHWDPAIGDRAPDVTISEHLRLHQLFSHTRFTLLGVLGQTQGEQLASASAALDAIQAGYAACVKFELIAPTEPHPWPALLPIADPEGNVARTLNVSDNGEFVLVRPDGYIGFRCNIDEYALLERYLASFLITPS
jgi:2-polyprenyl-6-methoxyphenol hydroxylase-like FAD-dependent oxidoreductase